MTYLRDRVVRSRRGFALDVVSFETSTSLPVALESVVVLATTARYGGRRQHRASPLHAVNQLSPHPAIHLKSVLLAQKIGYVSAGVSAGCLSVCLSVCLSNYLSI